MNKKDIYDPENNESLYSGFTNITNFSQDTWSTTPITICSQDTWATKPITNSSQNTLSKTLKTNSSQNTLLEKTESIKNIYSTQETELSQKKSLINLEQPMDKVVIDIAAICQEYSVVESMCDNDHTFILDEIPIMVDEFINIFYHDLNQFGINKSYCSDPKMMKYLSLEDTYRKINKKPFFLCNTILKSIENDLNLPRNCFTPNSLIEITGELTNIKSLCDLNCCSVLASLTWNNIKDTIKNYRENCVYKDKQIIPVLVISIMFKTPTPGVKINIIKIPYRIIKYKEI
jgi:hypothetical protein